MQRASAASGDTNILRARLAAMGSDAERLKALVELVQEDIAAVLALPGASSVRADVPLKELGLDSLMAVELRNRLSARVGTKLPTTLAFDYPTPTAMAQLLVEKLELGAGASLAWGEEQIRSNRVVSIQALVIGPPGAHHDAPERHLTIRCCRWTKISRAYRSTPISNLC